MADKNGKDLKVGDSVTVDAKVTAVNPDDTVVVEFTPPPGGGKATTAKVSSTQCEKC